MSGFQPRERRGSLTNLRGTSEGKTVSDRRTGKGRGTGTMWMAVAGKTSITERTDVVLDQAMNKNETWLAQTPTS